jgi:hypothetical protein
MAAPQWHAVPTAVIAIASAVAYPSTTLENIIVLAGVVGLGILVDVDHLSIRRVKKILRGEKGPVPGWTNWGHTWWFATVVAVGSFLLGNWLAFLSYAAHMLMDGGNRDVKKHPGAAPLPEFIHRFCPERWKYETGLII